MIRQALWLAALGLGGVASAQEELPWWMGERRIIGENNLEGIEATLGTPDYDKAAIVARVETVTGSGFCTASRVAKDLFLTNFHCFEFKPCEEIQFRLGYERNMPEFHQAVFRCKEVLVTNLNLDYALYRVQVGDEPLPPGAVVQSHEFRGLEVAIPDGDNEGVSQTFEIDQDGQIVDFKLRLVVTHEYVRDLQIELVSPAGTSAMVHNRQDGTLTGIDRTYTSLDGLKAFAGEEARGTWTINLKDVAPRDTGTLHDVVFTLATVVPGQGDDQSDDQGDVHTSDDDGSVDAPPVDPLEYPIAALWGGDIEAGQLLLVASHPAARHKEIDRSEGCVLRSTEIEVIADRQTITHTCDTEGGSSGSPILDRETGRVVALHWGGMSEYNLAIPMKLIIEHMEQNLPAEAFSELTIVRE